MADQTSISMHKKGCHQGSGHKAGRWCWTFEDVASLDQQCGEGKSWHEISESFKFRNEMGVIICRHSTHDCFKKKDALDRVDSGEAVSGGITRLGKRPTQSRQSLPKKLAMKRLKALEEEKTAEEAKEKAAEEAEEAALDKAIAIKMEPLDDDW